MAVQISGNDITVPRDGSFTRNVTIGGTLTYEDVTNIDSVGLVTARSGIEIGARPGVAASISVDGNMIVSGISTLGDHLKFDTTGKGIIFGADGGSNRPSIIGNYSSSSNNNMVFNVTGSERVRIDSVGTLMVQHTSSRNNFFGATSTEHAAAIQLEGSNQRRLLSITSASTSDGGTLVLARQNGDAGTNTVVANNNQIGRIDFQGNDGTNFETAAIISAEIDGTPGDDDMPGRLLFKTTADGAKAATERLRITSAGRVLIGDDTTENTIGLNARVQTFGTDASTSSIAIRRGSNDAQAAFLVMSKSRNTSVGSRTILNNGDEVGNIFFAADDGTDLVSNTAAIKSQVDGAPGANDTPGNLSFWTTADGANSAVRRMTIDSNGHVTKPYQFHIEVDRDSDQTGYNASANFGTPMIFNRVIRTIGTQNSALDTSTGKITVPVAGVYFLEATAYATTASFQQGWFTEGTGRMNYSDHAYDSKTNRIQTVGMHYLPANTEVGYKPYGSGESNVTIGDSVYHTWFRVTLIG